MANPMSARRAAYETLRLVQSQGAYANLALNQVLKGQRLSGADRAFTAHLVYTTLDRAIYYDYVIDQLAQGKVSQAARQVLRLGLCQLYDCQVPDAVAVDQSVQLIRQIGKGALAGLVNGLLRRAAQERPELPDRQREPLAYLSVKTAQPAWLCGMWVKHYGPDMAERMLSWAPAYEGVQLRAHGITADELIARLGEGVTARPGRLAPDCLTVKGLGGLAAHPLFAQGLCTAQGEASMLAVRALELKPGMRVLDACAAPGGKSAYMAQRMDNRGEILSCDVHPHRVTLMEQLFARLHVDIARPVCHDAAEPWHEGEMDAVLVDAPCSGLGVLSHKPDLKARVQPGDIDGLCALQGRILQAAARSVRPGGRLVYCTCTISRRENERVAQAFARAHEADFAPADLSGALPADLLGRWGLPSNMVQLIPCVDGTDGFFIAAFDRKEASTCS